MIWAILAAVGVPLWLCAAGILTLLVRDRSLRKRPGNVPVRLHHPGKRRWSPGHGVWIRDVFAFRGLPAAGRKSWYGAPTPQCAQPARKNERSSTASGDEPVIATLTLGEGGTVELAARAENKDALLGPFATADHPRPVPATN
jgi:hypothetical protein